MSSLRLSYASSPESDLEHSPGPPNSPGLTSSNPGRLTKANSDPSVVMPESSTTDALPPYQVNDSLVLEDIFFLHLAYSLIVLNHFFFLA